MGPLQLSLPPLAQISSYATDHKLNIILYRFYGIAPLGHAAAFAVNVARTVSLHPPIVGGYNRVVNGPHFEAQTGHDMYF